MRFDLTDHSKNILDFGFTYKACFGAILGFNDYEWKSGTPIE
jgi:hypothetical protein